MVVVILMFDDNIYCCEHNWLAYKGINDIGKYQRTRKRNRNIQIDQEKPKIKSSKQGRENVGSREAQERRL